MENGGGEVVNVNPTVLQRARNVEICICGYKKPRRALYRSPRGKFELVITMLLA